MKRESIALNDLRLNIIDAWAEKWFLLTAGELGEGRYNTMTVAWGSFGVMWGKPFAQVVVRPSRHTFGFMNKYESFTLCAFPPRYRDQLMYCGTHSGRVLDKVAATGLTPIRSSSVAAPAFDEAELIVECRKIYSDDFKPENFQADYIEECYGGTDYHRIYFGEILAVCGLASYAATTGAS